MIANPFDYIDKRLTLIETLLLEIKSNDQVSTSTNVRQPATREEAAAFLNLSLPTFDKLLTSSQINYFRIGRQVRIKWDDIQTYVNKKGAAQQ
ncbi:excisionase family DNA-binding protein [uncultured Mucilaginibacter sp.]|uniref:excisionase family DNA-binding protein n=1 Tax=uncultured Mucilaginibacter sp. TaxID=797541 RepID=UPI0025EBE3C7|nr:excisionase family DNA-binding protein [uncultured Mucilaginibacter sp.]